jgi:hypothetical protein
MFKKTKIRLPKKPAMNSTRKQSEPALRLAADLR